MADMQLDLFAAAEPPMRTAPCTSQEPVAADMDDERLLAFIPESSLADSEALCAEAGRRGLAAAVPALASLCHRFAGFGAVRAVPEQVSALQALGAIGGADAAAAVARMLEANVVQGPTLAVAIRVAAMLRSRLSSDVQIALLQHPDATVRAACCRCARPAPQIMTLLVALLDDLDKAVARAAACALGQMGRAEARPMLRHLLSAAPTEDVIEAVASIADDECVVLLARIARTSSALSEKALECLDSMDNARASPLAAGIRQQRAAAPNSEMSGH